MAPRALCGRARAAVQIAFQTTGAVGADWISTSQIADDSQPMDWASDEAGLQLPTIPDAAWPAVFANFVTNVGSTVGSYHAALAADATYLSQFGSYDDDVIQLLSFEIEKANAAFTAQTLVTVTADSLPAPGMDLTFVAVVPAVDRRPLHRGHPGLRLDHELGHLRDHDLQWRRRDRQRRCHALLHLAGRRQLHR